MKGISIKGDKYLFPDFPLKLLLIGQYLLTYI